MIHAHASASRSLEQMHYSPVELDVLMVSRHFFRSFTEPASEGWIAAFGYALRQSGPAGGPHLALAVLNTVQAMRHARAGCYRFSNPTCACCTGKVTNNEATFMSACRAAIRGQRASLDAHALLLCEGADASDLVAAFEELAEVLQRMRRLS